MNQPGRPLVTIGLTTYNRADSYLRPALESALAQGYPNLEILVSDNGSTDGTEALVRSFSDPRLRYIKHERNIGATPNFNFCVAQARGVYFLLLHDDDLIDPDFIETCMAAAEDRTDYGLIRTGLRRIDERGRCYAEEPNVPADLSTEAFFRAYFRGHVPMHLCSTLFNTERLRAVEGFRSPHGLFCDVVPEVRLIVRYKRLDIPAVMASFRTHSHKFSCNARVVEWCVDARFLLDIILSEVGSRDASFRQDGMHFFARHCLPYARMVPRARDRWIAYFTVYRSFDHATAFLLREHIRNPIYRLLKNPARRIKARLNRAPAAAAVDSVGECRSG